MTQPTPRQPTPTKAPQATSVLPLEHAGSAPMIGGKYGAWPQAGRVGRPRLLGNQEIALAMELQSERCTVKQIARGLGVSPDTLTHTLYRARLNGMRPE